MPNGTSDGMQDSMDIKLHDCELAWQKQQRNTEARLTML
jgi:hypothetical protein